MKRPRITFYGQGWPAGERVTELDPACRTLHSSAIALGYDLEIMPGGPPTLDSSDALVIRGSANWYQKLWRQLLATPLARRPLVAIWHTEPLPASRASGIP